MKQPRKSDRGFTRRQFLSLTGGAALAAGGVSIGMAPAEAKAEPSEAGRAEPFWGAHQGGILTAPQQAHTYFTAFDLTTDKREDVIALLKDWTEASARMTAGQTAQPLGQDIKGFGAPDGGDALGLAPQRLTITFGFGPGLFVTSDGKDRYGLLKHRPEALVDLPRFAGDQLEPTRTGGDISIQACADDPQVAFHAVRELARLASGTAQPSYGEAQPAYGANQASGGVAQLRWAQAGFLPNTPAGQTSRNLMGFKDGTSNPAPHSPSDMASYVLVGSEGPTWMRGGSYMVARRIRIALEHWDKMNVGDQETIIGRHKYSGAPLGGKDEFDPPNLDATGSDGNYVIADGSHVRLARAATNDGGRARIMRRAYSYNDGVNLVSERWPPWRQGMEYDAGLFFMAYQKDPRTGFIKIFENMSKIDMLNQFTTHTGGGIFACPGGIAQGGYIGQALFEEI